MEEGGEEAQGKYGCIEVFGAEHLEANLGIFRREDWTVQRELDF